MAAIRPAGRFARFAYRSQNLAVNSGDVPQRVIDLRVAFDDADEECALIAAGKGDGRTSLAEARQNRLDVMDMMLADPWWDEVDNRFEARLALLAASKAARAARRAEQEATGRPITGPDAV